MTAKRPDPGFTADVMASDNEEAKQLLRRLGLVEISEVCEHSWHPGGKINGRIVDGFCQNCGLTRKEAKS